MSYQPAAPRYQSMVYRRCGRSGLQLPAISLGLWHSFDEGASLEKMRGLLFRAFDLGITHFDLANNYGPPPGAAEESLGRILASDLAGHRDELLISTKAGYPMWPGPYGDGGSRKYLLASLDQSLRRLRIDYVDIFYSHRFDPDTPLEETMGALDYAVRSGRARYVGVSSYSPQRTAKAVEILQALGTPLLIHQPSYSMLNRWVEDGLLAELDAQGMGCIAFTALAQGLLTNRYLTGIPADSRAAREGSTVAHTVTDAALARVRGLAAIAEGRGQTLAQMALAWVLRDPRVTSVVMGASSVEQLDANLGALDGMTFTADELAAIDEFAVDSGVDLWADCVAD